MRNQIEIKHDEFCEIMKKQDKALLELLKQGHRELIAQTIKDYLSLLE